MGNPRGSAVEMIAAERRRQVEVEGWSPEHDAEHADGQLAQAAACYALPAERRGTATYNASAAGGAAPDRGDRYVSYPTDWPWHPDWWKPCPEDRIRELVKAGALIAAEIDRLIAARNHQGSGDTNE